MKKEVSAIIPYYQSSSPHRNNSYSLNTHSPHQPTYAPVYNTQPYYITKPLYNPSRAQINQNAPGPYALVQREVPHIFGNTLTWIRELTALCAHIFANTETDFCSFFFSCITLLLFAKLSFVCVDSKNRLNHHTTWDQKGRCISLMTRPDTLW